MSEHPLCVNCENAGNDILAEVVDHIKPHRGDPALCLNQDNLQSLYRPYHNRKTEGG